MISRQLHGLKVARRLFLPATMAVVCLASAARGDLINFNPTGGVTTAGGFNPGTLSNIAGLNFGSGDAVAVGAITPGQGLVVGTNFTLYYQTRLVALNLSDGSVFVPAGLNAANGFQITEVAAFRETVTSVVNGTATFQVAGGPSAVNIYFEDLARPGAVPANAATGAGFIPPASAGFQIFGSSVTSEFSNFTDTTVANGLPRVALDPLNPTGKYAGVMTEQGQGGVTLNTAANFVNTAFFQTPGISISQFSSDVKVPFSAIPASALFNDPFSGTLSINPNLGTINGVNGTDFAFQISGAAQSFAVPEPASVALTLLGFGGMTFGSFVARRRRAQV